MLVGVQAYHHPAHSTPAPAKVTLRVMEFGGGASGVNRFR